MAVGGVDTYYDYDEKLWKSRRLGGGPVRRDPVCPTLNAATLEPHEGPTVTAGASHPKPASARASE